MTPLAPARDPFSARWPIASGFLVLLLLFGGFGGWSVATRIDGAVIAAGQVEVDRNRQVVQHPEGGMVTDVAVSEGQRVAAGDLLLRLDGTDLAYERALVEMQLFDAMARRARLTAERDNAPAPVFPADLLDAARTRPEIADLIKARRRLFDASLETFHRQIEGLGEQRARIASQIAGLDAQNAALVTQGALIEKELVGQRSLMAKGLAQTERLLALEREAAGIEGERGAGDASRAEALGRRTGLEIEGRRLAAARREAAATDLRDVVARESDLALRRQALDGRISRLEIRAPIAGLVLGLAITAPHMFLKPAEPALSIVPQDRPLIVTAEIAPAHIDEVHVGQPTRLVLPGLAAQRTPDIEGHITVLSADALTDSRSGAPYYRAEIAFDRTAAGAGPPLLPGMPVEAYIRTGARSPLSYLLKPFTDYFSHAFREG